MKGWKTIIFNIIGLILVIAQYFVDNPEFLNIDPQIFVSVIIGGNIIIRLFTSTPVFKGSAQETRAGPK